MKSRTSIKGFFATWGVFFALYLWLAATLEIAEVLVGAILGGLSAWLLLIIQRRSDVNFVFRWSWLLLLAKRLPGQALADCAILFRAFGRRTVGKIRAIHFDKESGAQKGEVTTRCAVVLAAVSLSPNTIAISIDPDRKRLLVHQLVHSSNPPGNGDRLWPL